MSTLTNDKVVMSKIAFERMQAKDERNDHSKNIIIILLILLLVVTNGMWLFAWMNNNIGDDYSVEIEQNDSGDINYTTESIIIRTTPANIPEEIPKSENKGQAEA